MAAFKATAFKLHSFREDRGVRTVTEIVSIGEPKRSVWQSLWFLPLKTLIIGLPLFLTSCAEMAAQRQANAQAAATQQQALNDADDAQCRSYGVKPGSNAYVACRMNLANNRQQAAAAAADRCAAAMQQQTQSWDLAGAFYRGRCAAGSR